MKFRLWRILAALSCCLAINGLAQTNPVKSAVPAFSALAGDVSLQNTTASFTDADTEAKAARAANHRRLLDAMQQAILLNPQDMRARFLLGKMLTTEANSAERLRGEKLLQEVSASGDQIYSAAAKNWLEEIRSGNVAAITRLGTPASAGRGQPGSFAGPAFASAQGLTLTGGAAPTNVAVRSEQMMKFQEPPMGIADFDGGPVTAFAVTGGMGWGPLLVACGTNLKSFDWTGIFGYGSDERFKPVPLPVELEHPITAIRGDKTSLWLGTDGEGLIKITTNGPPVIFGEKDGFPMASIRALAMNGNEIFIGFGRGSQGAFGCLDLTTSKFTAMTAPDTNRVSEGEFPCTPQNAVWQIRSGDEGYTWWVGCFRSLYTLNLGSRKWTLQLPAPGQPEYPEVIGLRTVAVDGGCAATILSPGGVGISKISQGGWTHLNLSSNVLENRIRTIAPDRKYLWAGGAGRITILDMTTQKIIGQVSTVLSTPIELIVVYPDDVFFMQEGGNPGSHVLYHMRKPAYP